MIKTGVLMLSRDLYVHFCEVPLRSDEYLLTFSGEKNAPAYCMNLDEATIDKLIDFLREMKG